MGFGCFRRGGLKNLLEALGNLKFGNERFEFFVSGA